MGVCLLGWQPCIVFYYLYLIYEVACTAAQQLGSLRMCNRYCNGNRKVTVCPSTDTIIIADTVTCQTVGYCEASENRHN